MATTLVYPNGEYAAGGTAWHETNCSGTPWTCLNNGVDTPDDTENLNTEDWVGTVGLEMESPNLESGTCTAIRVRIRANLDGGGNFTIGIYDGASQIGSDKSCAAGNSAYANNWTSQWTGLSLSEANLSDFRVKVQGNAGGPCYFSEMEVELTYTPPGPENIDQINDVDGGSIGEINDTTWANVAEVNDTS